MLQWVRGQVAGVPSSGLLGRKFDETVRRSGEGEVSSLRASRLIKTHDTSMRFTCSSKDRDFKVIPEDDLTRMQYY